MNPSLPDQIIHAASLAPRIQGQSVWGEVLSMFALPHPSVAMAACIMFGIAAGAQFADGLSFLQQDWTSFLYISDGGWL
jgi:hypothetical protein